MQSHCKDSQKISLKLYSVVTHFVNFKHNFHREIETFFKNKLKWIQEKCFKMNPLRQNYHFGGYMPARTLACSLCVVSRHYKLWYLE